MRATELRTMLAATIEAKLPVLIKGAPGVGKSDIVTQAAKAAGAELVLMHPVVSDPTDFKGLPTVVEGEAEFLPFGDLRELTDATGPTVAFLDDLGQAPAVVQAAAMQLILARRVNGHRVSDHVVFVAATNRREDRAGVTGILEPVKSRFASIVELEAHLDDWCEWALENGVAVEVVAFCRFRPELFANPGQPTADIVNRPCPRTITQLSRVYTALKAAKVGDALMLEALAGSAGQGFATEFVGFMRIFASLPSIDAILLAPEKAEIPTEPAALYAVATALAARANDKNADRVIKYLSRLPDEFSVLGVRDTTRRCKAAASCPAFVKWAVAHQDVLN